MQTLKKIVLIEPLDNRFFGSDTLKPPHNKLGLYALEKLAGVVQASGFQATVIGLRDLTTQQLVNQVVAEQPFLIGFSTLTLNFKRTCELAEAIQTVLPRIPIIIGGYHISEVPQDILASPAFAAGVVGYGERPLTELAYYYGRGIGKLENIAGLVLPDHKAGTYTRTDCQTLPATYKGNWAQRNWQAVRAARCSFMSYPTPAQQEGGVAQLDTELGCRFNCTFCSTGALLQAGYGQLHGTARVSYRDAEDAAKELRMLRDKGVRIGFITTPTFNSDSARLAEVCNAFIAEGTHSSLSESDQRHIEQSIHLYTYCKVGITHSQAELMARAGVSVVATGVEAANPARIKAWNKPYSASRGFEVVVRHMQAISETGMLNRALVMFPMPDDNLETLDHLIECLKQATPDCLRVSWPCPAFGTVDGKRLREAGQVISDDYDLYDHNHQLVAAPNFSPEQLKGLRLEVYIRYHMSDEYRAHVENKLIRFPWLTPTFRDSFEILYRESKGRIDLRHLV